ncbi:hypothetical protein PN836_018665 [Ningiella sp. W23]|uniref:hypothetical protein n=1 Tax=Ningiella sp. W23 TaxID=3023715 RepID=UPI0037564EF1
MLDLLAPKAKVVKTIKLSRSTNDFLKVLNTNFKLKGEAQNESIFRVPGNFFSDLRAVGIVFGRSADPKHYKKVGFNVTVKIINSDSVELELSERIILGYFEIKAFKSVLQDRLEGLIENYT